MLGGSVSHGDEQMLELIVSRAIEGKLRRMRPRDSDSVQKKTWQGNVKGVTTCRGKSRALPSGISTDSATIF